MSEEEFHSFAAYEKGTTLKPFSFTPHPLSADDVEIEIKYCGVCHSDLHQMTSGWGATIYPIVPGHEIIGNVVKKGDNVKEFSVGDRVGVGPHCWGCLEKDCFACTHDAEPYCSEKKETYNDQLPDGFVTRGGYGNKVRTHQHFVFKIPDGLSSEGAAPLLCAGITTYSSLKHWNMRDGKRVGILGIGGLGHLGIRFAKALGNHVVALSSSNSKVEVAKQLGADDYVVISDKEGIKKHERSLDFILATASANVDWTALLKLLRVDGVCCLVGLPEEHVSIHPFALVSRRISFAGSAVGGHKEMNEMFHFAAQHKIEAWVEVLPLGKVNEVIQDLIAGKPRFRYVLKVEGHKF